MTTSWKPSVGYGDYVEAVHAIGIDVGSSNVKVVIVDENSTIVSSASRPLRTDHAADAGSQVPAVTQDPAALWTAVADAIRETTSQAPLASRDVKAIGVCSQYSSLVGVDAGGSAVSDLVMYMDTRGTDRCLAIMEAHPDAFELFVERHGIPPIGSGLSLSHLLHFQHDQPEVHERTSSYLEAMDFVNLRLTGRAAATQATMFASQLCDNRTVGVTEYDRDLVDRAGVDPSRLPDLIEIDGTVGEVDPHVAADLGLPPGVVVRSGMNDTQAGAFATGVLRRPHGSPQDGRVQDGRVQGIMIGTTAVIIDAAEGHSVDLEHEVLSMPSPIPGRHLVMAENGIAGRAVEHFLGLLYPDMTDGGFDDLSDALDRSAPGASGVIFLPWLAGSMSPSANATMRGGLLNMSLTTRREDLFRAAVEGTAFNLAWLAPAVGELSGNTPERIVFGGGAARSAGWAQVLADVLGTPVSVLDRPEFAAATAVATVALLREAGEDPLEMEMPVGNGHLPEPSVHRYYQSVQPQFEAAFESTRSICEALGHE
ncbi:MAG: FGGY family carbohydrate kinase [Microthrixaceae bacterium]